MAAAKALRSSHLPAFHDVPGTAQALALIFFWAGFSEGLPLKKLPVPSDRV
jgi:hypothetical protein